MYEEAQIEANVVAAALEDGWSVFKITFVGKRGAPDQFFAKRGRVVFIEFKRGAEGVLSENQRKRHDELIAAGLSVYVCRTEKEGRRALGLVER